MFRKFALTLAVLAIAGSASAGKPVTEESRRQGESNHLDIGKRMGESARTHQDLATEGENIEKEAQKNKEGMAMSQGPRLSDAQFKDMVDSLGNDPKIKDTASYIALNAALKDPNMSIESAVKKAFGDKVDRKQLEENCANLK